MKTFYKTLITFLVGFLVLSSNAQASCCNAGFSSPNISSSGEFAYLFMMHDSTAADIQSVQWSFGDSTFSNQRTPIHFYHESGDFSVTLTVIRKPVNGIVKSCTETHVLSVINACSDFSYAASNLIVSFYQLADFNVDSTSAWARARSFVWAFGDGQTSTQLNPVHTYAQPGTYNVCMYQYRKNTPGTVDCSVCHTIIVRDTVPPVNCNAAFIYTLTDTLLYLHGNDSIGESYWWIEEDTSWRAHGNEVVFVTPSKPFRVCHRQYTDSIVNPGSAYCTECISIQPPVDTVPSTCNSDFRYHALTDSTFAVEATDTALISSWSFTIDGSATTGEIYHGNNAVITVPRGGELNVCHFKYSTLDSCITCKVIRERVDTIPLVCNSDFNYTVIGNTVITYADSASAFGNIWNFSNEASVTDTLSARYVFTSPGIKRICQSMRVAGHGFYIDTCTTCKDVLIEEADITIHPNPAVNQIKVKSNDEFIATIQLYDINGNVLRNLTGLNVRQYHVDVSDLVSGIYYLSTVLADGRINRTKIIIQ